MRQNIILLAGLLCLASCTSKDDKAQQDTYKALRNEVVETTPVEMRAYGDELTLNGDVSCDEALVRKVFIPCSGRVSGWLSSTARRPPTTIKVLPTSTHRRRWPSATTR